MGSVRISQGLDRCQRICRFLSFTQFAELMVLSELPPAPTPDAGQLWLPAQASVPPRQVLAAADGRSIVQVVTEVGALADALCLDGDTDVHIAPGDTQLREGREVRLVARTRADAPDAPAPARPVLVDLSRLLLAVRVAHGAPARFIELIAAMVRRHVWIDVDRLPGPR